MVFNIMFISLFSVCLVLVLPGLATTYINIFQRLHEKISDHFDCTPHTVFLSASTQLVNDWLTRKKIQIVESATPNPKTSVANSHTNLLLSNLAPNFSILNSINHPQRFSHHCSIVFIQISQTRELALESNKGNRNFKDNLLKLMSNLGDSFIIYFSLKQVNLTDTFLKIASVSDNKVFLIPKNKTIFMLKQIPGFPNELITAGIWRDNELFQETHIISKSWEDLDGRLVSVAVCPLCENEFEEVKTRRIWVVDNLALLYEALCKLNATIDPISVFSLPSRNQNEDGEWDDYTQQLIEGTAAIATMLLPSASKLEVVYFSTPYAHDSALFILGLPKKVKFDSLLVLKEPLDNQVWIAFCFSTVFMLLCLQLVIYNHYGKIYLLVVQAVVSPIIDQISQSTNLKIIWKNNRVRFLFGLWLLSLIVLSCAYKCNLISAIVIPRYGKIPTTFLELSRSSYKIGAVLYTGVMENDFKITDSEMSHEIMHRVVEHDYITPDCYQMILEDHMACLVYTSVVDEFATQFLVDIYGQTMYQQSDDHHFHAYIGFGVSKYYPVFLEPLNYITSLSNSVGLSHLYHEAAKREMVRKGRVNARKLLQSKPYYEGNRDSKGAILNKQFESLITGVVIIGSIAAGFVFAVEVIIKLFYRCKTPDDVGNVIIVS